ncbi:helix-turn-helix domain-containing protein [Leuconostoc gasicomitatum]|uniref:helix-turn-helix domain-containing protein n=1 Tax=Leuconostoc gelidum group TaxID=3016637 RepID=UPI00027E6988|nr:MULTISPECIES: helix-turn-helix domain-containing protein [Leuconostoc gelidum group]AFS40113.1 Transcriptional activator [Leuconostoc gelidum JB7]MBZ5952080.1 helix-turn-helix domain-containing protein [Leuconostoc gasicomitatum]MBZ5968247.1 helix-turn-helix domain-containing protein [Leuconostoc gasicomitatum]MBZ5986772.1 helix-turn-helix domain-containing protein [Leuconostoc gelidum subsp. gelidum]QDJ30132.1 XRE family transcriptional regulator [Leuconostoc gelidum subsp. gelidum]
MQKDVTFNLIKERRKIKNISQSELGRIIGSQAMVSRIENGQILPNLQTIHLICKTLDLTVEEYFYTYYKIGTDMTDFRNDLDKKYMSTDTTALEQQYSDIKATNMLTLKHKHQMLMIQATIYHKTFKLASSNDQNFLLKYFDQIMRWQLYDIYLLECTLNMMPSEKIKPYISDILVQYIKTENKVYANDIVLTLIVKYLESSIVQKKDVITDWILLKLEDLKIRENSNSKIWFLFLIALYQHDTKKINQAYTVTDYLNAPYLKKKFILIQSIYLT